jgi:hypothetical protein
VKDDPDLRSELERLAASVGDPPEHGLDRVAARRHRRLRRRRGAVATAAVLAVLTVGIVALDQRRDPRDTVTSDDVAAPLGAPAELPRAVDVGCTPAGIDIPVASVRPERDGLHVNVTNSLGTATVLTVTGDGWRSGEIPVPPGAQEVRQPVPPGDVTIGCQIGGDMQRRQVAVVDVAGYYRTPELECDDSEAAVVRQVPVPDPDTTNIITAARQALYPVIVGGTDGDAIGPLRGYVSQRLGDATADPVVQVARDGSVVAIAHVRGLDGAPSAPWVEVSDAKVCASLLVSPPAEAPATDPPASGEPATGHPSPSTATTSTTPVGPGASGQS